MVCPGLTGPWIAEAAAAVWRSTITDDEGCHEWMLSKEVRWSFSAVAGDSQQEERLEALRNGRIVVLWVHPLSCYLPDGMVLPPR